MAYILIIIFISKLVLNLRNNFLCKLPGIRNRQCSVIPYFLIHKLWNRAYLDFFLNALTQTISYVRVLNDGLGPRALGGVRGACLYNSHWIDLNRPLIFHPCQNNDLKTGYFTWWENEFTLGTPYFHVCCTRYHLHVT